MGTLFVAGVYGVGKSTLCQQLSDNLKIPAFSASDLISSVNGEQYGANKAVSDKIGNQDILALEVDKQLKMYSKILLTGHFCIFNYKNGVDCLPENIYEKLNIRSILLIEADTEKILKNLSVRDQRNYSHNQISKLQKTEKIIAQRVASRIGCNFYIHSMLFDGTDLEQCLPYVKGV